MTNLYILPDPDDATINMVRSALREGPARSLSLMSGGIVRMHHVDAIIEAANGKWSSAARAAVKRLG